MNQAILFNDDHHYDTELQHWIFTGILSGENVQIIVDTTTDQHVIITDAVKFDWEILVEDWLENNELTSSVIHIKV